MSWLRLIPWILSVVALSACGRGVGSYSVDSAFEPYVRQFEQDAEAAGRSANVRALSMHFGATARDSEQGFCADGATPQITINPKAWAEASETTRKVLVYHELGHCVLGRTHRDDQIRSLLGPYPASLMHSELIRDSQFLAHREEYLQEFFSN